MWILDKHLDFVSYGQQRQLGQQNHQELLRFQVMIVNGGCQLKSIRTFSSIGSLSPIVGGSKQLTDLMFCLSIYKIKNMDAKMTSHVLTMMQLFSWIVGDYVVSGLVTSGCAVSIHVDTCGGQLLWL